MQNHYRFLPKWILNTTRAKFDKSSRFGHVQTCPVAVPEVLSSGCPGRQILTVLVICSRHLSFSFMQTHCFKVNVNACFFIKKTSPYWMSHVFRNYAFPVYQMYNSYIFVFLIKVVPFVLCCDPVVRPQIISRKYPQIIRLLILLGPDFLDPLCLHSDPHLDPFLKSMVICVLQLFWALDITCHFCFRC